MLVVQRQSTARSTCTSAPSTRLYQFLLQRLKDRLCACVHALMELVRGRNIAAHMSAPGDNDVVRKAIVDGFKETDATFCAEAAQKGLRDGCTAVTVTLVFDTLFVGWVGDSKAVLARRETEDAGSRLKPLTITKDHNTTVAKERERIAKAGGFVENNRVNGIMEVTRSIGDRELKRAGVIRCRLPPRARASHGHMRARVCAVASLLLSNLLVPPDPTAFASPPAARQTCSVSRFARGTSSCCSPATDSGVS
jgi:serine/threonine protein phosphatase PrpC